MSERLLTFLVAPSARLTKTYYANGGSDAYPHVLNFNSVAAPYNGIEELYTALTEAADCGACLLKGHLTREIRNESRRGLTVPNEPTDLLVIDYDAEDGFGSPEELLSALDPALEDVSYIFHHSASAGIKSRPGIRGHYFIQLAEKLAPALIKQWFLKLNFTIPQLRDRIRLSANGMSLCYPLDTSVGQNDKLIYLASPVCKGFEPPDLQRFTLVRKSQDYYALAPAITVEANRQRKQEVLERLQAKVGMEPTRPKYELHDGVQIVRNPVRCAVTGAQRQGPYIRINLNGGDSWAYWYWADNPEILYSFKDEDPVLLKEIAPEHYAEAVQRLSPNVTPFVFHEPYSDKYYTGAFDQRTGKLVRDVLPCKKERLVGFMQQFGREVPRVIPDWVMLFDPTRIDILDPDGRWINTYRPTKYHIMQPAPDSGAPRVPPTIEKVIRHITVDEGTYRHFLNWLACIFQTRQRTQTAWIFGGTYGTGKGTLLNAILKPLLGSQYCKSVSNDDLADRYNAFLEDTIILWIDEGNIEAVKDATKMLEKLKTIITEPELSIRAMYSGVKLAPNYNNVIIATNAMTPVRIGENDRRYNVAPLQQASIQFAEGEWARIATELDEFAAYLNAYEIDVGKARTVLHNQARADLLKLSRTVTQDIFQSLRDGDLDFFLEARQPTQPLGDMNYSQFEEVVNRWEREVSASDNEKVMIRVYQYELRAVVQHLTNKETITEKAFGWVCRQNQMDFSKRAHIQRPGATKTKLERYIEIFFKQPDPELKLSNTPAEVLPFKPRGIPYERDGSEPRSESGSAESRDVG